MKHLSMDIPERDRFVIMVICILIFVLSVIGVILLSNGAVQIEAEESTTVSDAIIESVEVVKDTPNSLSGGFGRKDEYYQPVEIVPISKIYVSEVLDMVKSEDAETSIIEPYEPQDVELIVTEEYREPEYSGYLPDRIYTSLDISHDRVLRESCAEYNVPYEIALALIYTESGFNPNSINPYTGCFGYCQLHPLYFDSTMSPEDNIRTGISLLGDKIATCGDIMAGITSYAVGHDNGSRGYASLILDRARTMYGYNR